MVGLVRGIIYITYRNATFEGFGFTYIEQLLALQGRRLEVVFPKDTDDDLVNDFVSVITSIVTWMEGRRNSRRKAEHIKQCVEQVMRQEV